MNEPTQAVTPGYVNATVPWTQTLYWSVRRELWQNRSIYLAQLVAASLMLFGYLFTLRHLARDLRDAADLSPELGPVQLVMPYTHAGWVLTATALIVGIFYSLDALHDERRDRSILFWKSLPVSDLITVLAKALVPLFILPALAFGFTLVVQLIMLLLSTLTLSANGGGASVLWSGLPWLEMEGVFLYQLVVMTLWIAPIYGWFFLVSGWARRAVFLWAFLPPLALCVLEKIAFNTHHLFRLLGYRLGGFVEQSIRLSMPGRTGFVDPHLIPWSLITPGLFLSTPGLWEGLLVAAAFMFLAIRQRRIREPI